MFFLETPLLKKRTKYVLGKILPYEARAEFCPISFSFFEQWSFKKKCFWDLLTFNIHEKVINIIFFQANIFLVEDTHPIYWAHKSMLMADIKCLDLLLKSDITKLYQWQYFINQPGTALPTMKVDEIAQVLNQYKGHCDSVVYTPHKLCPKDSIYSIRNSSFDDRYRYQFKLRYILSS